MMNSTWRPKEAKSPPRNHYDCLARVDDEQYLAPKGSEVTAQGITTIV
ncbi:hypothetical protein [Enterococcus rotai]